MTMDAQLISFTVLLAIVWFLAYWILGGVFFAVVTVVRLGRVRKLRFSCLFSLLSLVVGAGSAVGAMLLSREAVSSCMYGGESNVETAAAVFGCSLVSVLGGFLIGAAVLIAGGFVIMALSRSKSQPWIVLEDPGEKALLEKVEEGKGMWE